MIDLMLKIGLKTVLIFLAVSSVLFIGSKSLADLSGTADVTVKVPAKASDFQFVTKFNTDTSVFSQNSTFEIEIDYGSTLAFSTPITIVAQWTQGTVQGLSAPSVDILSYVIGSATNGYNNTAPIIDTVNRKITWTIPYLPPNTKDQIVKFQLQTNSNYTASQNVGFSGYAYMLAEGLTITGTSLDKNYRYYQPASTSPTNTPAPTAVPTTAPAATSATTNTVSKPAVTPTPTLAPFISNVNINTLSDNNAIIYVLTNKKSTSKIIYGTSPTQLNSSISDKYTDSEHHILLDDLSPDKNYYYKIVTTDQTGKVTTSDLLSLKTATVSDAPVIAKDTFVVSSGNNILVGPGNQADAKSQVQQKTLVIPQQTTYDFKFSLARNKSIKKIKIIVRRKKLAKVLGASTFIAQADTTDNTNTTDQTQAEDQSSDIQVTGTSDLNTKEVQTIEVSPGVYSGRLSSNLPTGQYEMVAVVEDNDGNITETLLSQVKVVNNFTVISKSSNQPLEGARAYLSIYNSKTRKYDNILPDVLPIANPQFTDYRGQISLVLPQGKYSALVSNLGYKEKNVEFTIGTGTNDGFPTIALDNQPPSISSVFLYYGRTVRDIFLYNTKLYVLSFAKSLRFYNLISSLILTLLVIMTLLSFKFRTHIPLRSLFSYLRYHLHKIGIKDISLYIEGAVLDEETKKPLSKAKIYIIDQKTNKTLNDT